MTDLERKHEAYLRHDQAGADHNFEVAWFEGVACQLAFSVRWLGGKTLEGYENVKCGERLPAREEA